MLTKGKFLELLKSLDSDPGFFVVIIKELFSRIPRGTAFKLAYNLYMTYYLEQEGEYKLKSLITNEVLSFQSISDVTYYLNKLGYDVKNHAVCKAFARKSTDYCSHTFIHDSKEKEITFFE